MKKVISALLLSFLIISTVSPAQAAIKTIKIPTIIQVSAEQLQKAIDTLTNRADSHEVRIAELEKKVAILEEKVVKLEAKSVIEDGNTNNQQSLILKEDSRAIPQQDSTLNQRLSEFLGTSSNQLSAGEFIIPNPPDLGEIKLK